MLVKMDVCKVDYDAEADTPVLVLQECGGCRILPLWIPFFEASAIVFALESVEVTRPMTHDLLKTIVGQMGGEVLRVCVTGMQHDMYIARVDIQKGRTLLEIDARPSDAVALALRCGVAVYCDDALLKNQRVPHMAKESALTGALRKEEPHYIDRAQQNKYGRYKM